MRVTLTAICLAALSCSCTTAPQLGDVLAERLRKIPDWHPWNPMPPDARGTVVLRMDKRVAVRLDPGSPSVTCGAAMAIYNEQGYKAELLVVEVFQGHALGHLFLERPGSIVQAGDAAACKTP